MPEKAKTTHVLMANELVVYRRGHSTVWQCRYKVGDVWQRATTKERELAKAKAKAKRLMIEGEVRKDANLPFITRKFRHVAKLAIKRMQDEIAAGKGKVSYKDYERVINDYLIPYFGNHSITSVDYAALEAFDAWRIAKMGKAPTQSTLMTQNSALNRVFDEAVDRGFLVESNRPKPATKGKASDRRPAFEIHEVRALRANFDDWIVRGRKEETRELRALLRDYVDVLLDTGARPGDELMNLQWQQIQFQMKPQITPTRELDEEGELIELSDLNRSCLMMVDGKTGPREIAGMKHTVKAFERIIQRNYGIKNKVTEPFKGIAIPGNADFVFRTKDKSKPTSFQKMFEGYLDEHNLLIDPATGGKRVFYSLRHTYATLALTHDVVPLETLRVQMGTSIAMIEKHYSHLKVRQTLDQLRRRETRRLLESGAVIDEVYRSRAPTASTQADKSGSARKGKSA
jgi:integrase